MFSYLILEANGEILSNTISKNSIAEFEKDLPKGYSIIQEWSHSNYNIILYAQNKYGNTNKHYLPCKYKFKDKIFLIRINNSKIINFSIDDYTAFYKILYNYEDSVVYESSSDSDVELFLASVSKNEML